MPKSVCEEGMQSTHLDNNEVIIEYMTSAHGNKIKKLKPIFIKSEPDREYTHHVVSDDDMISLLYLRRTSHRREK